MKHPETPKKRVKSEIQNTLDNTAYLIDSAYFGSFYDLVSGLIAGWNAKIFP